MSGCDCFSGKIIGGIPHSGSCREQVDQVEEELNYSLLRWISANPLAGLSWHITTGVPTTVVNNRVHGWRSVSREKLHAHLLREMGSAITRK